MFVTHTFPFCYSSTGELGVLYGRHALPKCLGSEVAFWGNSCIYLIRCPGEVLRAKQEYHLCFLYI